jgi:hypothetical protein
MSLYYDRHSSWSSFSNCHWESATILPSFLNWYLPIKDASCHGYFLSSHLSISAPPVDFLIGWSIIRYTSEPTISLSHKDIQHAKPQTREVKATTVKTTQKNETWIHWAKFCARADIKKKPRRTFVTSTKQFKMHFNTTPGGVKSLNTARNMLYAASQVAFAPLNLNFVTLWRPNYCSTDESKSLIVLTKPLPMDRIPETLPEINLTRILPSLSQPVPRLLSKRYSHQNVVSSSCLTHILVSQSPRFLI